MTVEVSDTHNDDNIDNGNGDGLMSVTGEPSSDPMENRLIPPPSLLGQQLRSCWFLSTSAVSQHIGPPSTNGLSEHCHIRGCLLLKFLPGPLSSSVLHDH